jgi:hypothetical protein
MCTPAPSTICIDYQYFVKITPVFTPIMSVVGVLFCRYFGSRGPQVRIRLPRLLKIKELQYFATPFYFTTCTQFALNFTESDHQCDDSSDFSRSISLRAAISSMVAT